jgi:hypothetical protein
VDLRVVADVGVDVPGDRRVRLETRGDLRAVAELEVDLGEATGSDGPRELLRLCAAFGAARLLAGAAAAVALGVPATAPFAVQTATVALGRRSPPRSPPTAGRPWKRGPEAVR